MQVVAEGLAHPLVTWSTLALDVFPAWSPAWFTISGRKIVNTAPTPATAVRHRLLVVFRANRSSPAIEVPSPTTPMTLSDHKAIQQEESSASLLPRKLVWHRREALSFFFFLFALREGGHALRGEEMARSCFAAPSTHTCPV